LTDCQRLTRLT